MAKDRQLDKFSPLSNERITEIIERSKAKPIKEWLVPIAVKTEEVLAKEKYKILAEATKDESGNRKEISKEFINENIDLIGEFLKDCRLIGTLTAINKVSREAYVIGAEGVSLINEYLATKPSNSAAHEVMVVRNSDFYTDETGSSKTANIMMDKKGIHSAWAKALSEDLSRAKENNEDLNKTYLVETFSSTGGNHFVAVTVRKKVGEDAPLVDFFDPSPGLLRGNIETFQNSIAVGFAGQIMVDATLTKVFREQGLQFDSGKYFNNCEPFQMRGSANCSIFSYEKAYTTASLSREEHEKLLTDHYRFDSPFGGKGEIDIDLTAVHASEDGKVHEPRLNMPPQYMAKSQFSSNVKSYYDDGRMDLVTHKLKSGEEETVKERYDRYAKDAEGNKIPNSLIDQKMLRQKYGHLFEIVTSPEFLQMAQIASLAEIPAVPAFSNSAYFPDFIASEIPDNEKARRLIKGYKASEEEKRQGMQDIIGLNDLIPFPTKITSASYDEATNKCQAVIYVSDRLKQRLEVWARENAFDMDVQTENFDEKGFQFSHINPILRSREKVILTIPVTEESFKKIADTDKKRFEATTPLPRIGVAEVAQLAPTEAQQGQEK
ncbi:MAG: hypothetical protein KGQ36_06230 [Rickettsiales bacterium]|nr:hypothetical protein [Rickettsiales bacterium]